MTHIGSSFEEFLKELGMLDKFRDDIRRFKRRRQKTPIQRFGMIPVVGIKMRNVAE